MISHFSQNFQLLRFSCFLHAPAGAPSLGRMIDGSMVDSPIFALLANRLRPATESRRLPYGKILTVYIWAIHLAP